MVTNVLTRGTDYVELEGEHGDTKPTENIGVNSKFHELDTGDTYYYDGTVWKKAGAS